MVVMVIFSAMPMRRKSYEVFLLMHILGATLFVVFLYQ